MVVSDHDLVSHVDAAYNLARWLTGTREDAQDVVQEAFVQAIAHGHRVRGSDGRAWLLAIVRNGCYTLHRRRRVRAAEDFDEARHSDATASVSPEASAIARETSERVRRAVAALPPEFREAIVLREFEGLSYKEMASVIDAPIGTVMSRLSRARALLHVSLGAESGVPR